jgi:hypothetical protein
MPLHASVCKLRLGVLIGGHDGAALIRDWESYMSSQQIENPFRFATMLAPGF